MVQYFYFIMRVEMLMIDAIFDAVAENSPHAVV